MFYKEGVSESMGHLPVKYSMEEVPDLKWGRYKYASPDHVLESMQRGVLESTRRHKYLYQGVS